MAVTSIEELQKYASGMEVELPGFVEGVPFIAKLRRPSMLTLCKSGKIPNSLLTSASELFTGSNRETLKHEDGMQQMFGVLEIVCEASFVEPTYQALKDAGIELTDEQVLAVFNYSQTGIKALEPFRTK